ncbi:MAG: ubiquinone/menaquinone biosynthesis methyltransferase [Akkermansiaceae bacterium]|nr:ubiquinone/menaquinone biosynthesis methyltransferase [Akkermansiaceae bacterium]
MPDSSYVHAAFSAIAPHYVAANHLLSLGMDILWRARAVQLVAEWKPARLLDIATGTGDLALDIERALPEVHVLGTDFCEPMLEIARRRGLRHVLPADAMHLPLEDDVFDAATIAFGLRNMPDYAAALREFRRVLRPGGHLLVLDLGIPEGVAAAPYRFYLHRVLPKIAACLTEAPDAYTYLGRSIEAFPRGQAMLELLTSTGYAAPAFVPLMGGIAGLYFAEA